MVNVRAIYIKGFAADAEMEDIIIIDAPSIQAVEDHVDAMGGIMLYAKEATQEEVDEAEEI